MEGELGLQHPALRHRRTPSPPRHQPPPEQPGPGHALRHRPATECWLLGERGGTGSTGSTARPPARSPGGKHCESPGTRGHGAGTGLIGVKPGEFGTAVRKSRPVREPGAGRRAAGPHSLLPRPRSRPQNGSRREGEGSCRQPQPSQRDARKCKINTCHPGLSNNPPLEGNLAHVGVLPAAKSLLGARFHTQVINPEKKFIGEALTRRYARQPPGPSGPMLGMRCHLPVVLHSSICAEGAGGAGRAVSSRVMEAPSTITRGIWPSCCRIRPHSPFQPGPAGGWWHL